MTSYANTNTNETPNSATPSSSASGSSAYTLNAATTPTGAAFAAVETGAATASPSDENTKILKLNNLSSFSHPNMHYDSDSQSDGREKADTTPENIKKIDDVIEQHQRQRSQASSTSASAAAAANSIASRTSPLDRYHHHQLPVSGNNGAGYAATPRSYAANDVDNDDSYQQPQTTLCNEYDAVSKSKQHQQQDVSGSSMNDFKSAAPGSNGDANEDDDSSASNTTTNTTTTTNNKYSSYSFIIEDFNDKKSDPSITAAKYKNMMERFQNRHRRGASMSKLESDSSSGGVEGAKAARASSNSKRSSYGTETETNSTSLDTESEASAAAPATTKTQTQTSNSTVKLRPRDRSASRVREAAKRHSWSPRSSTQELSAAPTAHKSPQTQPSPASTATPTTPRNHLPPTAANSRPKISPKTSANQNNNNNNNKLIASRTANFVPRSTAMQMALIGVDMSCPVPPLDDDFKQMRLDMDMDSISEAGTYTVYGDNYTEEEKDRMNIDASTKQRRERRSNRPTDLNLRAKSQDAKMLHTPKHAQQQRTSNVLEVNYYHDAGDLTPELTPHYEKPLLANASDLIMGSHQSGGNYYAKVKARVLRNLTANKIASPQEAEFIENKIKELHRQEYEAKQAKDKDMGFFTSVTTSGVLAKQGALDTCPKLTRRSSLSTSQIDSSEYVLNEKTKNSLSTSAYAPGDFVDRHQTDDYRLNLFINQKEKFAATRNFIESPPETPRSGGGAKLNDTAGLKTARTKNDWIREWARNARARSLAHEGSSHMKTDAQNDLMTRSYTCASSNYNNESLTDDSLAAAAQNNQPPPFKLNKTLAERYRLGGGGTGDCDFSSDPALSTSYGQDVSCKPPKSPSKIPSPLHSLGRARSASRTRASLPQMEDMTGGDIYLQKTAAAINNLQQSLSRKNSLKSPTHSASPRAHSARSHMLIYSPEDGNSPHHSMESPTAQTVHAMYAQRSPRHRRNLSNTNDTYNRQQQLMTSSYNEHQLQLLTSGEYLAKQMRMRKNSFDGQIQNNSPTRRVVAVPEQSLSPIRRSSSLSAKIATQRPARPQFQNIYTPPAARHQFTLAAQPETPYTANNAAAVHLKKSASSNSFGQMYSDYDDNIQYYINDEDDFENYSGSSGGVGEDDERNFYTDYPTNCDEPLPVKSSEPAPNVPLTNTRMNKALLMRIERSKQKVSGGKVSSAPPTAQGKSGGSAANSVGGVVACPNTPELPRRNVRSAPRVSSTGVARQSMPRDTSLSRLANQVPNSLASAKKQLLQTAAAAVNANANAKTATANLPTPNVQSKYLDISKYKSSQGNSFLRKNDAKSTLKTPANPIKRSPSSSSMGLTRSDPTRSSSRSSKSVASGLTHNSSSAMGGWRSNSAIRRDPSATKQKEAEMAMWKRRSTYDPMKAAAEDRRRKEEAKKLALTKGMSGDMPCESQAHGMDQSWTLDESEDNYIEDDEEPGLAAVVPSCESNANSGDLCYGNAKRIA